MSQHPAPDTRHPIVFVHGAGSNASFWHEQRVAFPDAHYLDLPGHEAGIRNKGSGVRAATNTPHSAGSWGSSGSWTTSNSGIPHSVEDYADWVGRYIEDEGLGDVVLNGHSMGGAVALMVALRRPAWLTAIILTGTGARLQVKPQILELLRADYKAAVDLIIAESFAPGLLTYKQKARINGTRRQMLRIPQAVTLADYNACDSFDVMSRVGEIHIPTLCIVGAADKMTPPKYSEYLHREIAGSRLEVIEGAGHMLPLEKPEEYNRKVVEFLGSIGG